MHKKKINCQPALDWLCQKYLMNETKPPEQEPNQNHNGNAHGELDENEVRRALSFIPSDDYEMWMDKIGHSIKSAVTGGLLPDEVTFKLWDEWSQKSDEYDADVMRSKWNSIKPDGRIHISTLFWTAQRYGFIKKYKLTENGNAQRFADLYRCKLRWYPPAKRWLFYDGIKWATDNGEKALKYGREFADSLYKEAADCKDEERKAKLAKWAITSNSAKAINAMIGLAKSDLVINTDELDADLYKLNVLNGTLDLKTGQLLPHCADNFITKLAPVVFDPQAKAPRFEQFLKEIFNNVTALIEFILRWFGYCLTGDVREEKLILHHGVGQNGKSKLLDLLLKIMGDYGQQFSSDLLLKRNNAGAPNEELFNLRGKRLASTIELNKGVRLDEALLKWITGGDPLVARACFGHLVSFLPSHKINIAVNDLPHLSESEAVWRRIIKVPYAVKFADEPEKDLNFSTGKVRKKDTALLCKLLAETPGILNLLLKGCLDWQKNGLQEPLEVQQATNAYKESVDILSLFIEDCCVIANNKKEGAASLHRGFLEWCRKNNEPELNIREFKARLEKRGFKQSPRTDQGIFWQGIALQVTAFDEVCEIYPNLAGV